MLFLSFSPLAILVRGRCVLQTMDPAEREAKLHLVKYEQVGLRLRCCLFAPAFADALVVVVGDGRWHSVAAPVSFCAACCRALLDHL